MTTPSQLLPVHVESFELKSRRLYLRSPTAADAAELFPLVSDARLTTFLAWEPHQAVKETLTMIESLMQSQQHGAAYHWVVLANDTIVGLVSLIDVKRTHRTWVLNRAELAYWIGCPFQGSGYATEAANAVLAFGLQVLRLHKIRVYHASDNPASGRTIEKLPFRFVGEEFDAFYKAGEWHSLRHFEALAAR